MKSWAQQLVRMRACTEAVEWARTALRYVPEGKDRPRLAIECAERFARGEATSAQLASARAASWADHCRIIREHMPEPPEIGGTHA
jgi:hypothetical protein